MLYIIFIMAASHSGKCRDHIKDLIFVENFTENHTLLI